MGFDTRPVYEADQVITEYDIVAIRNGYILQYNETHWWNIKRRFILRVGVGVCSEFLSWIRDGKPQYHIKSKE